MRTTEQALAPWIHTHYQVGLTMISVVQVSKLRNRIISPFKAAQVGTQLRGSQACLRCPSGHTLPFRNTLYTQQSTDTKLRGRVHNANRGMCGVTWPAP